MVTAAFDHRLDEHARAHRLYYRQKSWFARADKVVAILLVLVGVAFVALHGVQWWTVIWLVLGPLEWFDALSPAPLIVGYMFKRSPKFREPTTLTFTDDHIHYKTASIDSTLDWSIFAELVEDDALFLLLYKAPRSYAIIPKRAFASPDAIAAFRELARRKLTIGSATRTAA